MITMQQENQASSGSHTPHTYWPQAPTQEQRVSQSRQDVVHAVHVQALDPCFGHVDQAAGSGGGDGADQEGADRQGQGEGGTGSRTWGRAGGGEGD